MPHRQNVGLSPTENDQNVQPQNFNNVAPQNVNNVAPQNANIVHLLHPQPSRDMRMLPTSVRKSGTTEVLGQKGLSSSFPLPSLFCANAKDGLFLR
jgi:hypothetical protein